MGLATWAYSCSLVIGDIPEAVTPLEGDGGEAGAQDGSGSEGGSQGKSTTTTSNGGEAGLGAAGAPAHSDSATNTGTGGSEVGVGGTTQHGSAGGTGGSAGSGTASSTPGGTGAGAAAGSGGVAATTSTGGQADGGTAGVPVTGGSGGAGTGGVGGCNPCDCDNDGALSEACAGDDCDDNNDEVFPGQVLFFDESSGSVGFDYNCDDRSEREFQTAVNCAGLALLGCESESEGFLGALPSCGTSAAWGGCRVDGLSCVDDQIDTRLMRCR